MSLHILYVIGCGELAGIQRHVQALLRHLPPVMRPHVCILFEGGAASARMQQDGVPTTILGARSGHDPQLAVRFHRLLSVLKPDVIHEQEGHLLPLSAMLTVHRNPVLVHTEHCAPGRATSAWKDRVLYHLISRRASAITAVSEATLASVRRFARNWRGPLECIPNGIDVQGIAPSANLRRELGLPPDALLVGAVGRLAQGKGWLDLVKVGRKLVEWDRRIHVVIAGDGPLRDEIVTSINSTGASERFHLLGARPDGDAVIGGLDLFLLTSVHEEMPTTVLEAFAQRTPVAGFVPEGGYREILARARDQPAAIVVPSRDPAALASEAIRVLSDPRSMDQLTRVARSVVECHFDMARISQQYVDLYASCLAVRRDPIRWGGTPA
jgi:glycosyltransferase involved in cell wall biosynthesis